MPGNTSIRPGTKSGDAFNAGYEARQAGVAMEANPFSREDRFERTYRPIWRRGWLAADDAIRVEELCK